MNIIDKLSYKMANLIVSSKREKFYPKPIEGISEDICDLKRLREELKKKDEEIARRKVEWDRTFDAIIDNITIIDSNFVITKANKAFIDCVSKVSGFPVNVIGKNWKEFRSEMGIRSDSCPVEGCFETKVMQEVVMNINDLVFSVSVSPIFDENGNVVSVVRVARDMTNAEKQKRTLDRRSTLFKAVSEMGRILVDHDNFQKALVDILGHLGRAVGAHRAYVFDNQPRDGGICAGLCGMWLNPRSEVCEYANAMSDCINYNLAPELRDTMEKGGSIQTFFHKCDMCPDKNKCDLSGTTMISAVPIFSNKEWWGFIGFDYYNGTKKFRDEDETVLRIAADIIGGVIYRRKKYFDVLDIVEENIKK